MQIFTSEHYQPLLKLCCLPFNQPFNLAKLTQFIFEKQLTKSNTFVNSLSIYLDCAVPNII